MTTHIIPLVSESLTGVQPHMRPEEDGRGADGLARRETSVTQPPPGFPTFVDSPMNWSGLGSSETKKDMMSLDNSDVTEIKESLQSFNELQLNGDEVNKENFPLPSLRDRLNKCAYEVHQGSGLCVIRGLKPEDFSVEDNIVLFLGLASYIGDQRGIQSSKGDMLSHVIESKSWTVPREKRHGIHTNTRLPFHTDMGCEILSIQVRDRADAGGRTCVASIDAIYNDLLRSNPWVIHTLAKHNWAIQSYRKEPSFVLSPLIEFHAGKLLISMDPARIGPHPLSRNGSIPEPTEGQQEALAVLQRTAQRHQVELETQPGDIVFLNNLAFLHARESYQDGVTSSRHLVRLWLRNTELGWAIPPSMRMPWDAAFGERAGRVVDRRYPVMPMPEYEECPYSNGTAAFVAEDGFDDA